MIDELEHRAQRVFADGEELLEFTGDVVAVDLSRFFDGTAAHDDLVEPALELERIGWLRVGS